MNKTSMNNLLYFALYAKRGSPIVTISQSRNQPSNIYNFPVQVANTTVSVCLGNILCRPNHKFCKQKPQK